MRFMASCLFGLEKPVCDDIAALGYGKTEVMDGHVLFDAPESAIAECNVNFSSRFFSRCIVYRAFRRYRFASVGKIHNQKRRLPCKRSLRTFKAVLSPRLPAYNQKGGRGAAQEQIPRQLF